MAPRSFEAGPLEMQVLGILEAHGAACVADIQSALKKSGQELAYTTVMTVLVRLHQKGFVAREKEGRQFLYSLASKRGSGRLFERIRRSLFQNDRLKPILALLDADASLSADELKELKRAVDEKLKRAQEKA